MTNESLKNLAKPTTTIEENVLDDAGFINSGKTKYKSLLQAFAEELFDRSVLLCDAGRNEEEREVTREHVVQASHIIYGKSYSKVSIPHVVLQIIEYVFSAGIGVGASNLSSSWGVFVFGISLFLVIIAFVSRTVIFKQ